MDERYITVGKAAYRVYDRIASAVVSAAIYAIIFIVLTIMCLIPIAIFFGDRVFSGHADWRMFAAFGIAPIPACVVFYLQWRGARWRRKNPKAWAEEQAKKQADKTQRDADFQAALQAARNAPPGPLMQAFTGVLNVIFEIAKYGIYLLLVVGGGFLAYEAVSSMSVSVAIIVGAVIIGLCILAARER